MRNPALIKDDHIELIDTHTKISFSYIKDTFFDSDISDRKDINLSLIKIKVGRKKISYSYGIILTNDQKVTLVKRNDMWMDNNNSLTALQNDINELEIFDKRLKNAINKYLQQVFKQALENK